MRPPSTLGFQGKKEFDSSWFYIISKQGQDKSNINVNHAKQHRNFKRGNYYENCVWQMILVPSFSRAPVTAAYNIFSPVTIFVYKNFPISFLSSGSLGKVKYGIPLVLLLFVPTIPMPSFRTGRHLQTEVHFRPATPITSAKLPRYEIRQYQ